MKKAKWMMFVYYGEKLSISLLDTL